ncbi:MAG: prepilin peptidase [Alphaproteobacteria bacterium]
MILQHLALSLFAAVMAVAAFEDFRRLTIPNLLPLVLCAAWPLHVAAAPSLAGALAAVGVALAVFLGGAVLFARGWLGGGDVKLLAAATLWAGAPRALGLLVATALLGGVLALILLHPIVGRIAAAARSRLAPLGNPRGCPAAPLPAVPVPYGVAIAGAGLIVVVSPHLG